MSCHSIRKSLTMLSIHKITIWALNMHHILDFHVITTEWSLPDMKGYNIQYVIDYAI